MLIAQASVRVTAEVVHEVGQKRIGEETGLIASVGNRVTGKSASAAGADSEDLKTGEIDSLLMPPPPSSSSGGGGTWSRLRFVFVVIACRSGGAGRNILSCFGSIAGDTAPGGAKAGIPPSR